VDDDKELTDHERRIRELEATQRMIKARQAEQEKRLSVLEQMHASTDHLRYFHNLEVQTSAIEYWDSQGMTLQTIDDYLLGYCSRCPTDSAGRASYTIPVMAFGKLWNIRHRLIGGDQHDKYRPHIAGLPAMLFNADNLRRESSSILIVEGEKKSIITAQTGFANVGLMGKSGFKSEWAAKFARFNTVYVAMDPDAEAQAISIAQSFKGRGRVVSLPDKIDDLVTRWGATHDDIEWFIKRGTPV
jgi:DNA primase